MNPHDQNTPPREATFMLARLTATLLFGVAMFVVGYYSGEHRGYAEGSAKRECKPYNEVKPLTQKQKTKLSVWANRDRGVILK